MRFPYGVADFQSLRGEGQVYVDRTDRIAVLEELGGSFFFLRPRRFGKSLWLSTLEAYYDLRLAGRHEQLFDGLAAGRAPTERAHTYFVLRWDFSLVDPNPPLTEGARVQRIGRELHRHVLSSLESFLSHYRGHLPSTVELADDAFTSLDRVLDAIRETPYKLYLLVDEYDNFANEVLTSDRSAYEELVTSDGPFKQLFKWVKAARGYRGLDRFFITGVSPMVLSDVTSGMNIAESISLYPELNDLCGFTEAEVRALLETLYAEKATDASPPWTVDDTCAMMRDWYNGYRFSTGATEAVYNPTLVFYFLKNLQRTGTYPDDMLDANLAVDEGKLGSIAEAASGRETLLNLVRKDEPLEVHRLRDRFRLRELLEQSTHDTSFWASYLFYLGMLTLREKTGVATLSLAVPNAVVHGLYVERLRELLLPSGDARSQADAILFDFLRNGELEPLLDFIEATLFPTLSNRDALSANELTIKTIFLSLLWNDRAYITHSEPELDHRYADLCLLRRPDARTATLWDLLFELKRLPLQEIGMSGEEVRAMSRSELTEVDKVRDALNEADGQLVAYREALERRYGDTLRLRSYAVVALGFERLVVRPG